jgi:hypothetical protein
MRTVIVGFGLFDFSGFDELSFIESAARTDAVKKHRFTAVWAFKKTKKT